MAHDPAIGGTPCHLYLSTSDRSLLPTHWWRRFRATLPRHAFTRLDIGAAKPRKAFSAVYCANAFSANATRTRQIDTSAQRHRDHTPMIAFDQDNHRESARA